MRKIPWSLTFVSASFVALGALVLLPQPQVVGTLPATPSEQLTEPTTPAKDWQPVISKTVVQAAKPQVLRLELQVVDQDGVPIPAVQISCDHLTAFSIGHIFDEQTDAQGGFTSVELVHGTYELELHHPQFLATETIELHLPEDAGKLQRLQLIRGCVVEGQLFGGDGIPRNYGSLMLKRHGEEQVYEAKPDAEGGFRFPAVKEGQWEVSWYTNKQLVQDPRLSHTLLCRTGQSSKLQITIPTPDLRALNGSETMDVGIQELPDLNTVSPASEL
ncbi:MAG: carboxypeptidase regulatory-like domain-containing protein [Planctomycetes bacterium]|nr:carboxypeptidase regulatory-like domain-containing protein [Planctomycetota bacterium]MCP4771002.1 carboxypeptidase regulatory-like domain-containing protein [Planctomycetota bacterium]MCP4861721.1 carboxypeptidase regulatory-like domain-containing protein [Planctomycetota bacterium]